MSNTNWAPDICVFHGNCDDGFGAAWVVRSRWGAGVQMVAGSYGGFEWPADIEGKNILFVDFSPKWAQLVELANGGLTGQVPASIVVLDHHKTAEAELHEWAAKTMPPETVTEYLALNQLQSGYPILAQFDMDKSGARLAWEFCYPGAAAPALILHIEDRDLWKFSLPLTAEISAALRTYPHDYEVWDKLMGRTGNLADEGAIILKGHRKNIATFCGNAFEHVFAKTGELFGVAPVVNVPYHYASDCADWLLMAYPDAPFAAAFFVRADGQVQWSLRSRDDRQDVSEIAKAFGGGGHRNAAGFQQPIAVVWGGHPSAGEASSTAAADLLRNGTPSVAVDAPGPADNFNAAAAALDTMPLPERSDEQLEVIADANAPAKQQSSRHAGIKSRSRQTDRA
jgi:uncharacterized protein